MAETETEKTHMNIETLKPGDYLPPALIERHLGIARRDKRYRPQLLDLLARIEAARPDLMLRIDSGGIRALSGETKTACITDCSRLST